MRIKLIANPVSGGDARPRIQAAMDFLQNYGVEVDLCLTGARGEARKAAAQALSEGYDRVVAAGGDGTLNEVVNGVASPELPIAFLPFGTVNVFAIEAGISSQLEEACTLAVQGVPHPITLGRINGELFLLMVSAGWDAEAVAHVRPGLKRLIGRLAYAVSALEVLLLRSPEPLELTLPDGSCYAGFGVVASNCRYYGGHYVVTPEASMFRDDLEVCLLRQGGRLAMLKFAAGLLLKRPLQPPLVEFMTLAGAELRGENVSVQVDGDVWGDLPVRLEAVPRAVSMVLPDKEQLKPQEV
jgi:YegS/Rv2252/BmrU family lipid kinase